LLASGRREPGNEIITDQDQKVQAFTEAYSNILGSVRNRQYSVNMDAIGIQPVELHDLEVVFSEKVVRNTINEMHADHAPRPDGFMGAFSISGPGR
jgi:hypothetical protein